MATIAIPSERKIQRGRWRRLPDFQRLSIYQAEAALGAAGFFPSLPAVQAWVNGIVASRWWRSRFSFINSVIVLDGRGRLRGPAGRVPGQPWSGYMRLPRATRYKVYVLHELAHVLQPELSPAHGVEFCVIFLGLVRRWIGKEAAVHLRWSFRQQGVRWTGKRGRLSV